MSKYKRRRAKQLQGTPEASPERITELVGMTIEAMKAVAFCCCHMPDIGHPCPCCDWGAWEVFTVARQGRFPRATNDSGPRGQLGVFLFNNAYAHEAGQLALPYTVVFSNAGSRKPRPQVNLVATPMSGAIRRGADLTSRVPDILPLLIALMADCVDDGIVRCPDVYEPIFANEKNVEHMERLGCGYNALRFHIKKGQ